LKEVEKMEKIIWVEKISENKKDSIWYANRGDIAYFQDGDREIVVVATGDVDVSIGDCDITAHNIEDLGACGVHNDRDLDKLEWSHNNWFEFMLYKNDEYVPVDLDVAFDYDEAINTAERLLKQERLWRK